MYARIVMIVASGLIVGTANGAWLFLQNPADGTGSMDLGPGEVGSLNLMLEMRPIDTDFAYVTVYLNDGDDQGDGPLEVVEVIAGLEGPDVFYDRSGFTLPADISFDGNNEYGLIIERTDGDGWGPGTYILDTLVILNGSDELGEHPITFEGGERAPLVLSSDFVVFPWNFDFDYLPNFLDPLVGAEDNPFIINTIPEPATAVLVALAGLALLGRRRTQKP
ncbi:MAG: PEP-CTERM sorting domain-containing protein [Planctomycetes bacterium]|nr:PEP-CTERM sorting domain-containing protein [Planctomycetota bacterium]